MSIRDVVRGLVPTELVVVPSEFLGEETPRTVFATREAAELLLCDWDDSRDGRRRKTARGIIDAFTEGGFITVAERPFDKDATAILARVHPVEREFWDFRCLDPKPGIRVLGAFIARDEFLALCWDYRENLDDDRGWEKAINECEAEWKRLFGDLKPHSGGSVDEYIEYNFGLV